MLAGITIFILLLVVSPFNAKYYLIVEDKHAVIRSLMVILRLLEIFLTSYNNISLLVAIFFTPVNILTPS